MGDMALGYGSEFHLLRWLGRHRQMFTRRVCEAAKREWADIRWLDFKFNDGRLVPDRELCGIEFLDIPDELTKWLGGKDRFEKAKKAVEKELRHGKYKWADVRQQSMMNWDVVGVADDGTFILGEAKAHTEEIHKGGCGGNVKNKELIRAALRLPKEYFGAEGKDWLNSYYQLANRLYMVALLERCGLKAAFLYILFTGDKFPGRANPDCPVCMAGWRKTLDDGYKGLGLAADAPVFKNHVIELDLPVVGADQSF